MRVLALLVLLALVSQGVLGATKVICVGDSNTAGADGIYLNLSLYFYFTTFINDQSSLFLFIYNKIIIFL